MSALLAGADWLAEHHGVDSVLVVACDLPNLTPEALRVLVEWPTPNVVPRVDGQLQYLCAKYDHHVLAEARRRADTGERSLRWIDDEHVAVLDVEHGPNAVDSVVFGDLDTPADAVALGIELPTDRS